MKETPLTQGENPLTPKDMCLDSDSLRSQVFSDEIHLDGLISVKNEILSESIYTRLRPTGQDLIIAGKQEKFFNRSIYGIINEKNSTF